MSASVLWACASSGLFVLGVVLMRAAEVRRAMRGARVFKLRFGRDTDGAAVVRFAAGLTGVSPPWYWRWLRLPTVMFELHAEQGHIEHRLIVARALTGVVMSHLRASLPSVRLIQLPEASGRNPVDRATELRLTTSRRPLRTTDLEGVSAALLSSLQPLRAGERLVIQWLLTPARVPKPVRLRNKSKDGESLAGMTGDYELLPHTEALKAERAKQAHPMFWCAGRVGTSGASASRARYLLTRALGAYHSLSAPGVQLRRRQLLLGRWASRRLNRRTIPLLHWPALLNAAEVVGVLGIPLSDKPLPGLALGGCRQLPPSAETPSSGCVIAQATFPGSERPLAISPADRRLHLAITGPTGAGKSVLMQRLILDDVAAGRGVVVIDPAGDLVTDVLRRIPAWRTKDVIVLDPADTDERVVGLNLLSADAGSAELIAEHVVFIFHQLFSAFWGPRTDDVLRASLLTLMRRPNMTLLEVPLLLNNPNWRRPFVAEAQSDPVGLGPFWQWYESLKEGDRGQVIAPLMNKLRATLLRSRVRYCVGQEDPGLKLSEALNQSKILLIPLRKGVLGEEAAALLGSLLVSRIWQTIQARSAIPEADRAPVHLYIDEVQDYLRLPASIGDVAAQARKLGLGLTVAHQHLQQLPTELRNDLLANCRSRIIFQCTAKDARAFEAELKPYLNAQDLQGLDRFEVVARLAVGQRVAPPVTGVTLPADPPLHQGKAALEWSRSQYGRPKAAIEEAMRARHRVQATVAPVGHKVRRGAA